MQHPLIGRNYLKKLETISITLFVLVERELSFELRFTFLSWIFSKICYFLRDITKDIIIFFMLFEGELLIDLEFTFLSWIFS